MGGVGGGRKFTDQVLKTEEFHGPPARRRRKNLRTIVGEFLRSEGGPPPKYVFCSMQNSVMVSHRKMILKINLFEFNNHLHASYRTKILPSLLLTGFTMTFIIFTD